MTVVLTLILDNAFKSSKSAIPPEAMICLLGKHLISFLYIFKFGPDNIPSTDMSVISKLSK